MTGRLLQLSGAIVDLIYTVEAVPLPGEEAIVTDFELSTGGGFNAMVAAKRAGLEVTYGGALGSGPLGKTVQDALETEGISVLQAPDPHRDQGCCTVMIDRDGERTFVAREGTEGHVSARTLARIDCGNYDWILLSGYALYYPGSRDAFKAWLTSDIAIPALIFDPAPIIAAIPPDVLNAALNRALWLSLNVREAAILSGKPDPMQAAVALAVTRPANGGVVVRNGAAGCIVSTSTACTHVPGYPVTAIDTNGAGDTHLGSFLARLSASEDPTAAAQYANIAAALSTKQKGPATAPEPTTVLDIMKSRTAHAT